MSNESVFLCLGSPSVGPAASPAWTADAWRGKVLAEGLTRAAAGLTGGFAIGLSEPDGSGYLAVDKFAVQTLCYRVVDGRLRFAERADALADEHTEIDPQAIFDYLYFHCIPSPRTIFKGIHRLPPGCSAQYANGQLTVQHFWVPEFSEPTSGSFDALRDEFRHLLDKSVARQLDGSKPACFLSGGTDSSSVAGLIGQVGGRPASTYSIGFEAQGYDEMAFARIAAKRFGTDHHEYYVTPDDLVRGIGHVAGSYDQPFGNSSALPAYYCAKFARDDGVTKLLAGDGGDELFGGNSRYAMQRIFGWYGRLPASFRSAVMEPLFRPGAFKGIPVLGKGAGYINQAKVPMPDRLQMYNLLRRLGFAEVLTPGFLAQVDPDDAGNQQRAVWALAIAQEPINRTLAYDWRYTLAESDLPKVRGTTQLADVGVGFPFLDDELLSFSMRLPADYKLKGLKLRWFFKEALRGFLPDEIITKKKQGFGLPFGVWVTQHDALRQLAVESLNSFAQRGIVRPDFIRPLLETLLPEHPGYYGEMVWIVMMLEQWLRRHRPDYRLAH
ncbi:asparagine synthetase B [Ideonella sp. A 288]|uniref:asparagine synthetase B family protein n=1 Tax=Ideonella sp. A 288 TaxID=1962181 RepID=UPI000B4BC67A|nr:asparagine synthase C-terminal domain-containing protein [Ideonella sp. A 288]